MYEGKYKQQVSKTSISDKAFNPDSLDFKPIKGRVMLPSTHEVDAWNHLDAKRHFE